MGQKASTARKFQNTVINDIKRSNINQLPSDELKLKWHQTQTHPKDPQTESPEQEGQTVKSQEQAPKPKETSNKETEKKTFQPEGRDGADPDFIKAFSQLGRIIESTTTQEFKESAAIKSLRNRDLINEKNKLNPNLIDPKTLTLLLNDLNDSRYQQSRVLKDYHIDKEWLNVLSHFKPANNYVTLKDTTKKDEIGHQGTFERPTLMDQELKRDFKKQTQSDSEDNDLKKRISVD